jgi:SAM-dependent methyltransferase
MLNNTLFELIIRGITSGKHGVEIGGPSMIGKNIYDCTSTLDNVVYSTNTIWEINNTGIYTFYERYENGITFTKTGKLLLHDATEITSVINNTYDYCFSSHCLEHIANPLKAIKEYLRIVKVGGYLIIVVPEKSQCFDHKREYTPFSRILEQYIKNVGEDDLSTMDEILKNHDLSMDPPAGTLETFRIRCMDNYNNRCMHHFVYSYDLLHEICDVFHCEFICEFTEGINMWFIMKKNDDSA